MESLYHKTNGLIQETQECFQKLERLKGGNTDAIEAEIQARIDTVISNCERLDILIHKEPVTRKQNARLRIEQIKYDTKHLQAALRSYQHEIYKRKQEENDRAELLSRRFTHNNTMSEKDTTIFIDHNLQHNMSLNNAHRGMDDMLQSGSSILENMRGQRNTLQGARQKIMDIGSTLGLSNTTMRIIEKRAKEDKYIFIGLMMLTVLIIVLLLIYLL